MLSVKIRSEKYGEAIGLLLRMGGGFRTQFERTLIVNPAQLDALREAGILENGSGNKKEKPNGKKAK